MLYYKSAPYSQIMRAMQNIDSSHEASIFHHNFARSVIDKQVVCSFVVSNWRTILQDMVNANYITRTKAAEINANFDDYIQAIYGNYHEFVMEVMDFKNEMGLNKYE